MELRAILYEERAIQGEKGLLQWMETDAAKYGIMCLAMEYPMNAQKVSERLCENGIDCMDCLMIVTRQEEWLGAHELGLAALPYVNDNKISESMEPGHNLLQQEQKAPCFEGAWMITEGFDEIDYDFLNKCYQRAHNLPWRILETKRCYLRELALEDIDALFALYEQPGVTDYMEGLFERAEEEQYQRAYIDNIYRYFGYGMWLVCKRENDKIIGRAGLEHRDYKGQTELEMGYMISPCEQNKGYATEVCQAIVKYARDNLDFSRVNCLIQYDNLVSRHLAEKLNFSFEEDIVEQGKLMKRYVLSLNG